MHWTIFNTSGWECVLSGLDMSADDPIFLDYPVFYTEFVIDFRIGNWNLWRLRLCRQLWVRRNMHNICRSVLNTRFSKAGFRGRTVFRLSIRLTSTWIDTLHTALLGIGDHFGENLTPRIMWRWCGSCVTPRLKVFISEYSFSYLGWHTTIQVSWIVTKITSFTSGQWSDMFRRSTIYST